MKRIVAIFIILIGSTILNAYADNPASTQYVDQKFTAIQKQIDDLNSQL